jgi:hypothetical protein
MSQLVSTIPHLYNGVLILQGGDGYWNATTMCRANGKLWADYWRNQTTQEFMAELSPRAGRRRRLAGRGASPRRR